MKSGQLWWCLGGVFHIGSVYSDGDQHSPRMVAFGTYLDTTTGERDFREMYRHHWFKEVSEPDRRRLLRRTREKGFSEKARDILRKRKRK
jgi:hypothetical protein